MHVAVYFRRRIKGLIHFSSSQHSGGLAFVTLRLAQRAEKNPPVQAEVPIIFASPNNYDLLEVFYSNGRGGGFWTSDIISAIPSVENVTNNPLVPLIYVSINAHGCYHRASVWPRLLGFDNDYTDEHGYEWTPSRIKIVHPRAATMTSTTSTVAKFVSQTQEATSTAEDGVMLYTFLTSTLQMNTDCLPWHSKQYDEKTSLERECLV